MQSPLQNIIRVEPGTPVAPALHGAVAVMGNLDGVHRGHQYLIKTAAAHRTGSSSDRLAAIIFDPHPRAVFAAGGPPFLLTTIEQRASLLQSYGIDHIFVLPFSKEMAALSPEQFVEDILARTLNIKCVIVGEEFQFGRARAGNARTLAALGTQAAIDVEIVTPALNTETGDKYASSQARAALREGRPGEAARVLGRPWSVRGAVERGKQLGRTLSFPTANVSIGALVTPKKGVYAVSLELDGHEYKGVANFGERPTVDGKDMLLEVHIFNFSTDVYGQTLDIYFHEFIRDERKFDDLDTLKEQISADCARARDIFGMA